MDIDRQNLLNNDLYSGQSWAPVVERSTGGQAPVVVPLQGTPPPLVLPQSTNEDFHRWIPRVLTSINVAWPTTSTLARRQHQPEMRNRTTSAIDDGQQGAADDA